MKTINQLSSTDDIQIFIDYMNSEPKICQEACDYFSLFSGTMEEVALEMQLKQDQPKLQEWFIFGLENLFNILPSAVRKIYFDEIMDETLGSVIKVSKLYNTFGVESEKQRMEKYLDKYGYFVPKMYQRTRGKKWQNTQD